jgi:phosphate starvation-inducible protein PhoH and related proteins
VTDKAARRKFSTRKLAAGKHPARSNMKHRKHAAKGTRKSREGASTPEFDVRFDRECSAPVARATAPIEPKTDAQKRYLNAIKTFKLVFGVGPAGTGKTFIAGAFAAMALEARQVERIIITRPAVDAGESLGFLPGELEEKYEPYLAPLRQVFWERLGKGQTEYFLKSGKIEAIPLGHMRGMTFKNAIVLLDEAQNVTPAQMKMFLTRIGEDCTVIVNGDPEQKDITGPSGLNDAIARVGYIPSVKVVKFSDRDVVRSGLVAEIVSAYSKPLPDLPGTRV